MKIWNVSALLALLVVLLFAGCGGGGGGGSQGSGNLGVFLTDNLNANYTGVWVTLHKVEALRTNGDAVTLFEDTAGKTFNARALEAGGQGLFKFVGRKSVPVGTYASIRVVLDDDVTLYPTGQTNGLARKFANSVGGRKTLEEVFTLPKSVTQGGSTNLVCDFNLANWTDDGTFVNNASIDDGSTDGLDDGGRHVGAEYEGTISNLSGTAPNFTFTLTAQPGLTATIRTNLATSYRNDSGNPNPTLANGKRVEIRGLFDPALNAVVASSIKIEDDSDEDEDEAEGVASDIQPVPSTFKLTISTTEDFIPTANPITVQTSDTTRYFTRRGQLVSQTEWYALLAAGGCTVEVEGSYNPNTNVFTATKAKLDDDDDDLNDDDGDYQEIEGASSNLDATAGTFSVTVREWEGFSSSVGTVLNVTTSLNTRFRAENGDDISKEAFFAALAGGTQVKVEGIVNGSTIEAKQARIEDDADSDEDEAEGAITAVNGGAFTFTLRLVEWEGFNGSVNQLITVQVGPSTVYRGENGNTMTKEEFFALLATGRYVEAKGTVSGSTLTATRLKLEDVDEDDDED